MRKRKVFSVLVVALLSITSLQAQWSLTGNTFSPTSSPQYFLGTLNVAPLRFKTNRLQRVIIMPHNGFVGIGLNNPQNPLHIHANDPREIYNDYRCEGECEPPKPEIKPGEIEPNICDEKSIHSENTNSSSNKEVAKTAREDENNSYSALQITNCLTGYQADDGLLLSMENHTGYLRQLENANFSISMQKQNVITVTPELNVGIGTDAPYQKLHVVDGNILISKTSTRAPGSTNGSLVFGADINPQCPYGEWGIEYVNDPDPNAGFGLNFWRPWNPNGCNSHHMNHVLFLHDNGNVGIGTKDPTVKFDVIGTIRAHEVKVCLNQGCDYVFAQDYKLMSLTELEQYIAKNKHLPEVAPAAEMEAEGINVSEMSALLLKKVEELTLYIIEQQKQTSEQQKLIEDLQKRLLELESKKGGE